MYEFDSPVDGKRNILHAGTFCWKHRKWQLFLSLGARCLWHHQSLRLVFSQVPESLGSTIHHVITHLWRRLAPYWPSKRKKPPEVQPAAFTSHTCHKQTTPIMALINNNNYWQCGQSTLHTGSRGGRFKATAGDPPISPHLPPSPPISAVCQQCTCSELSEPLRSIM